VWLYRPEYQFSQFGLEMESILREYTDESGQAHQQELFTDQDIDKKIPTIRSNDDLVSVFYSLAQQQYNRLTPIDGEQELIFGLGANEVRATISSTGEIRFDNLAHLDLIDPIDDEYELLAKAIGSYNGGTGMHDHTWANMLRVTNPGLDDKGKPKMGTGHSNKTYALQVLRRFGAPARTYIWRGGKILRICPS
jgi:hypothetical protein